MTLPSDKRPESDGLPVPQRWLAMAATVLGVGMSVLDASITNVALPTIARELQVDAAAVIWVANAYQLVTAACIVALAGLSDLAGYRRVFLWGMSVFTLGSLACALSPSLPLLVASRLVQGLGAAALMAVTPALYRIIYPASMLGRALGVSALTVAASATCGPMVGGLILAFLPWPWLFAVNLPLGLLALWAAYRNLPANVCRKEPFDAAGAILAATAMGCFVIALDGLSKAYPAPLLWLLWAASGLAGFAFVQWQRAATHPLLPLTLFHSARFSLAAATSTCSFVSQGLAFVTLPFLFQGAYGYTPFMSGLLFTPWPLTIVICAPLAGRLADRISPPLVSTVGLAVLATGLATMAGLGASATVADIVWRASICGCGFGLFQSPNNRELLGNAPRHLLGAASGVLGSARTFGLSIGVAVAAVVVGVPGLDQAAGVVKVPVQRVDLSLWLACGAAGTAFLVSALRLGRTGRTP